MIDSTKRYKFFLNADGLLKLTTIDDSLELWSSKKDSDTTYTAPYSY
jgi:hypothetical protein